MGKCTKFSFALVGSKQIFLSCSLIHCLHSELLTLVWQIWFDVEGRRFTHLVILYYIHLITCSKNTLLLWYYLVLWWCESSYWSRAGQRGSCVLHGKQWGWSHVAAAAAVSGVWCDGGDTRSSSSEWRWSPKPSKTLQDTVTLEPFK